MASKLGTRLAALRDKAKVSSADLAKAMGISESTLGQILAGDIERPPDNRLKGAARVLEASFESLKELVPMREAAEGSYEQKMQKIYRALRAMHPDKYAHVAALFEDRVVAMVDHDRLIQYDYAVSMDGATLTNAKRVVETFAEVDESMTEACGAIIEAGEDDGRFLVRVIQSGLSHNGNLYLPSVLRESAGRFEGARVYIKSDSEHLRGTGSDPRNLIGRLTESKFVEADGGGEIHAVLGLLDPAGDVGRMIEGAARRDMADLIGFSIDAVGRHRVATIGGKRVRIAKTIERVHSVDLIDRPSAGGQLLRMAESEDDDVKLREMMVRLIEAQLGAEALEGIDTNDDDKLVGLYDKARIAEAKGGAGNEPAGTGTQRTATAPASTFTLDDIDARVSAQVRLVEARANARVTIAESGLPGAALERLTARFAEAETIGADDVAKAITAEREYLNKLVPGHPGAAVTGLGGTTRVELVEAQVDKMKKRLDALFDPADRSERSIKTVYIELTGDERVTGMRKHCDDGRLREAISIGTGAGAGVFADIFGDSLTRRMQREYRTMNRYMWWRDVCEIAGPNDFRSQERTRWGGYGDLPTVAQAGAYAALTSPTDEKETYTVSKRGGTEAISLEAIKNDDMQVVMRIPARLGRAAARTVSSVVAAIFTANSGGGQTLDTASQTLFHANHNNSGTAALSAASLAAGRLAMVKQPELSSSKRIGILPRCLLVPDDLEETAVNLFRRDDENDPTFVIALGYMVKPVPDWTDANDWVLAADPMDIPTIEIGFLDGMEEPEIFLQSMETVGSLFDNDQWKWKIRHIYGVTALDHRGLYKGIVA